MRSFHLLLLYVLFSLQLKAQDSPYFVEKLTTEEGLSSNRINDIAQDDNGFLWIATSDGLNRFDGTEVVKFYHNANANSIPHNFVYCLKMLPNNFLAIGTQAGLSFYNSSTRVFKNFYYSQNNAFDQYNNTIIELEIGSNGNLWAVARNCIFVFNNDLTLQKVIPSSFKPEAISRGRLRFVDKVLPLSDGNALLFVTNVGWNICYAKDYRIVPLAKTSYYNHLNFISDSCSPSLVKKYQAYFDASNIFKVFNSYFAYIKPCQDSLFLYDEFGKCVSRCYFPFNKYPYLLWSQQMFALDSSSLVCSFHNYGLTMIPVSWENNKPVIHSPGASIFEMNEYGRVLKDSQGNIWLATTEDGLQKISPHKQFFRTYTLINKETGRQVRYDVNSFLRINNTLWIGTYGEGFYEYDISTGKQEQHLFVKPMNNAWPNFIWNFRQISPDTLWIGTQEGMFWYTISSHHSGRIASYPGRPSMLDSVAITTQFTDSHGLTWIGLGRGKGLCYYDSKNQRFQYYPGSSAQGYPLRYPLSIAEDKNNDLWFVSDGTTIMVKWIRATGNFQTIPLSLSTAEQTATLSGISYESDSVIWLGTSTNGLIKFNPKTKSVKVYGHDKGLVNSHILHIYRDHKEKLWLVTDGGLSCFDRDAEIFTNYTSMDGLPVKYASAWFYYDSFQKRLYNGGQGTFFSFDPDSLDFDIPPRRTLITSMQVNGVPFMHTDEVARFSPRQNDISIHYTSVDLMNGAASRYAYKLVGEDTAWIMAGNQRQINFSHLAPGNYTFMVKSSNSNGGWSDQTASVSFYIRPPFSQTIWFYLLIALLMGGIFYTLYRFRLQQLMRTEDIRTEISRNLHDEVGSALTNISLGTLLAQKQLKDDGSISRILDRIYQDSRHVSESMREIVWSIDPKIDTLGDAFPRMLQYASEVLEAKNIILTVEMAPEIEGVRLSMQKRRDLYLIFKEAVNNLAKHSKATEVAIRFHLERTVMVMTIADNGTGFDTAAQHSSNGLVNMSERAHLHHWHLDIRSLAGQGTTITLKAHIA